MITASAIKSQSRSVRGGFTFIEILTVTVLIGVMVSIAVVGYFGAAKNTRDARRKQDIGQMQFALEAYKQTYNEYPDVGLNCGSWAYPACQSSGAWIQGLSPDFMEVLPNDPKQNGGELISDPLQYSYRYQKVSATEYYLTAKLENKTDDALNGASYGMQDDLYVVTQAR